MALVSYRDDLPFTLPEIPPVDRLMPSTRRWHSHRLKRCGTPAARRRHQRRREQCPTGLCRQWHNAANRSYRAGTGYKAPVVRA